MGSGAGISPEAAQTLAAVAQIMAAHALGPTPTNKLEGENKKQIWQPMSKRSTEQGASKQVKKERKRNKGKHQGSLYSADISQHYYHF